MKKSLIKFILLIGGLFIIAIIAIFASRITTLDNETVSMSLGILLGCAASVLPLLAMVSIVYIVSVFYLRMKEVEHEYYQPPKEITVQQLPEFPALTVDAEDIKIVTRY